MNENIESYVVDAASVAASRRSRRAKTDKLDGEALVRTLLAYKRGELASARWSWFPALKMRTAAASAASDTH
jgi:transposase